LSAAFEDLPARRDSAHLDHRLTLDCDRVGIIGFQLQRLVGHADSLAEKVLLLGDAGDVDEGCAIARISGKRGLQHILGLLKLAGADQCPRLVLQFKRLGRDLIVGTLSGDGSCNGESRKSEKQQARQ